MCGILGVLLADAGMPACPELYEGLYSLQHRGQDAAGITTCGPRGRMYQCKGNGMVSEVFDKAELRGLVGSMGIGHVRYPTAGSSANSEAQPFYVNSPYGIAFAHNGNLVNAPELRQYCDMEAHRHINTDSDSELLLNIFASELQKTGKFRINADDIFKALRGVFSRCKGGYTCVGMLAGFGIIGFRDPHGIRPLVIGERISANGSHDYMLASESVVCQQNGYSKFRDVRPGEAIIIQKPSNGPAGAGPRLLSQQVHECLGYTPDVFEYVYFARPDSVLDGISVYQSRVNMGHHLARTVAEELGPEILASIDVVIPVPDSARTSALQLAQDLGLPYREGFIKNRYVGRTFIMPGQQVRKKSVRRKLNAQPQEFNDKTVLLVDDSIVRGTTSREIVAMAREAGAKMVVFASCAPPIRHPHIYGIDLADRKHLVAYGLEEARVASVIGADRVVYQKLPDLVESCIEANPHIQRFEVGLFTGDYVTGREEEYLKHLAYLRSENAKLAAIKSGVVTSDTSDIEEKASDDISIFNHHHHHRTNGIGH